MNTKKKQSNGSEFTQPEPRKRFIRRNSFHILHCRSGSLNKLPTPSQDLTSLQQHTNPPNKQSHPSRRQTVHISTTQLSTQLKTQNETAARRGTGSMKLQPESKLKNYSAQKYEYLKSEYQLRGQQLQLLQAQCQRLKRLGQQQREKRKSLEEQVRLKQLQVKRLEKRAEKYRAERDQLQQRIETMDSHIQQLEKTTLAKANPTFQSYREQMLELELRRTREMLKAGRSGREAEEGREQRYNQEQVSSRVQVANGMLMKRLEQNQQELEQLRKSIHQTTTASAEYCQLRQKYRQALLQLREMRREMSRMEQRSGLLLEHTLLTLSDLENDRQRQLE